MSGNDVMVLMCIQIYFDKFHSKVHPRRSSMNEKHSILFYKEWYDTLGQNDDARNVFKCTKNKGGCLVLN